MRDLSVDNVKQLIESSDWVGVGLNVAQGSVDSASDKEEVNENEELEAGFYELEGGDIVYLGENGSIYDTFSDEEDNVFLFNEDVGLFQVFEDNDKLLFEAVDPEQFDVLEEDVDVDEEDNTGGEVYTSLP